MNVVVFWYVKEVVINVLVVYDILIIVIELKIDFINEKVELYVKDRFLDFFGIFVKGIDISVIEVDKENEVYIEFKRVIKDIIVSKIEIDFLNY